MLQILKWFGLCWSALWLSKWLFQNAPFFYPFFNQPGRIIIWETATMVHFWWNLFYMGNEGLKVIRLIGANSRSSSAERLKSSRTAAGEGCRLHRAGLCTINIPRTFFQVAKTRGCLCAELKRWYRTNCYYCMRLHGVSDVRIWQLTLLNNPLWINSTIAQYCFCIVMATLDGHVMLNSLFSICLILHQPQHRPFIWCLVRLDFIKLLCYVWYVYFRSAGASLYQIWDSWLWVSSDTLMPCLHIAI